MAKLDTMMKINWSVRCFDATNQWVWLYAFNGDGKTKKGSVTWKDEYNGKHGTGSWWIEGSLLKTRWVGSQTTETWDLPIETENWSGTCKMHEKSYTLNGKARNFIEIAPIVIYDKAAFLERCSLATTKLLEISSAFSSWLSGVSISYSKAYTAHNAYMEKIKAETKLAQDQLLGLITAGVGGGVGGIVGGIMKDLTRNELLIDGIKDIAKFTSRGSITQAIHLKSQSKMPDNPFEWQAAFIERVEAEKSLIYSQIAHWRTAVASNDPDFDSVFDPVKTIIDDLYMNLPQGQVGLMNLPSFDKAALQKDCERGWLVGWLKAYGGSVTIIPWGRDFIRSDTIDYGRALGIPDIERLVDEHMPRTAPPYIEPREAR